MCLEEVEKRTSYQKLQESDEPKEGKKTMSLACLTHCDIPGIVLGTEQVLHKYGQGLGKAGGWIWREGFANRTGAQFDRAIKSWHSKASRGDYSQQSRRKEF